MLDKVLLASHGTVGAQAAEKAILGLQLKNIEVTHLYVLPDFWEHILADDWLNNSITRERFGNYLESELAREIDETITRVQTLLHNCATKIKHKVIVGNPQKELITTCTKDDYKLVITGSNRPKMMTGLKSRMINKQISQYLPVKYLQVPHPYRFI